METAINSPCKGCTDRTVIPNCHGTCERYQAYHEARERMSKARSDAKIIGSYMTGNTLRLSGGKWQRKYRHK